MVSTNIRQFSQSALTSLESNLFVPPPAVFVRIREAANQSYLTAGRDSHSNGKLMTRPLDQQSASQWFSMCPGSGEFQGLYSIFSVNNNQWVVSGTVDIGSWNQSTKFPGPMLQDLQSPKPASYYFTLSPSADAKQFSILDYKQNMLNMMDAATFHPFDMIFKPKGQESANTQFLFEYEDMVFDHLEYKVDEAAFIGAAPEQLATQLAINDSEDPQTLSVTLEAEVIETSTFSLDVGLSGTISAEVSVGIPEIADAKVGVSVTASTNTTWGESQSKSRKISNTISVNVAPHHKDRGIMTCTRATVTVPFDAVYKGKFSGHRMSVPGVYTGVPAYDVVAHWVPV